jgi:hypothetical protein
MVDGLPTMNFGFGDAVKPRGGRYLVGDPPRRLVTYEILQLVYLE